MFKNFKGFFCQNARKDMENEQKLSSIPDILSKEPVIKSWIGIAATSPGEKLNITAILKGSLSKSFVSDDLQHSILFSRYCEIFTSKEEAFKWMGYKIRSSKSTYVLETPYNEVTLNELIATGHFHECIARAINVYDHQLFNHDPLLHHKIESIINPHFSPPVEIDSSVVAVVNKSSF